MNRWWIQKIVLVAALCLVGGCQVAQVKDSLMDQYAGNDLDSQMEFWHTLAEKKLVSNNEAFHALVLLYCGEDHAQDYGQRVARLVESNFLPASFDLPADHAVTRGTVGIVLSKMLKVRGGLLMQLFRPDGFSTQRYAVKEMVHLKLFPASSPHQIFTGPQLIEVIGRAEDYQLSVDRKASAEVFEEAESSAHDQGTPTDTQEK